VAAKISFSRPHRNFTVGRCRTQTLVSHLIEAPKLHPADTGTACALLGVDAKALSAGLHRATSRWASSVS
jgi:hypothetical protein